MNHMADLRVREMRTPRSRGGRSNRLKTAWAGSAALHLMIVLFLLLVRTAIQPPPPDEPPALTVEFEPDKSQTPGGPNPSKMRVTPRGEENPDMHATPNTQPQPDMRPQINIIPPEYQQPPEPPEAEAEPLPPPIPAPHFQRAEPTRRSRSNAFSHPMEFSYSPRNEQRQSAGLRNSRSLDLSAGPVIRGGHLLDSVAHVVGPGGRADYLALLSEFIEEHKYYPPEAARNGEDGSATVELTVRRDGSVKALKLVASSGSDLLDAAWLAVFRDNRLPPFTEDMPGAQETFELTLNYTLIYGSPPP